MIMELPALTSSGTITVRGIPTIPLPQRLGSVINQRISSHRSVLALLNLVLTHAEVLGHDAADCAEWMAAALDSWATAARQEEKQRGAGGKPAEVAAE